MKVKQLYIAIKVDMEKYYDKVEWTCILKVIKMFWILIAVDPINQPMHLHHNLLHPIKWRSNLL